MKIIKVFELCLLWFMDIIGINMLYRWLNRDKAIIIKYHGICEDNFSLLKDYDGRHLSKSSFRKQLGYLQRKGYSFISMTKLVNKINNGEKLGKNVALTFDDGFQNIINNAYPIIREFNARGCFYLVSGLIGTDQLLWTDQVETVVRNHSTGSINFSFKGQAINYPLGNKMLSEHAMTDIKRKLRRLANKERLEHLMQFESIKLTDIPEEFKIADWEQINELDPELIEIGNHTKNHPECAKLTSSEELEEEILLSKKEIENNTGRRVEHFCYPSNSYNKRVIDKVQQSGYKSAVTVDGGFIDNHSNLFKLNRVSPEESLIQFKTRISGSNQIFHFIRSLRKVFSQRKRV